ncbi:MAG: sensor histidine kinase [Myxococcota bacterium]|nr:sensor histidine kinase [Myxococcota bacterium]
MQPSQGAVIKQGTRRRERGPFQLRLRSKILFALMLVLLPLLGLLLLNLWENYEMRRESLLRSMRQTAESSGLVIDGALEAAIRIAEAVAAHPSETTLDPAQIDPFITGVARTRPDLSNVAVFDVEGNAVASYVRISGVKITDRAYFQEVVRTKQPAISEVLVGRDSQQPSVGAAAPIFDSERNLKGVAVVGLQLSNLKERLEKISLSEGQALFLIDPQGRLAFHSELSQLDWDRRDLSGLEAVRRALTGESVLTARFEGINKGEPRIAALIPTPHHGWVVGVSWRTRDAFGEMNRVRTSQLILFAVIAFLALGGAFALAGYISGRVQTLVSHARSLAAGDLRWWSPTPGARLATGDELDELTHAFNEMAGELRDERERRERFVASVAHEMKNLTTPLRLTAQILQRPELVNEDKRRRTTSRLASQVNRLQRLISDLLDASLIEGGRLNLKVAKLDLGDLTKSVVDEVRDTSPDHPFKVDVPQLEIEADGERLQQLISNLVSNAIKYTPEGGEVTLTAEATEDEVTIRVTDSGVGLSQNEQEEIFQPYARAASAQGIRGMGLGLFISRAIVEHHGGRLWAESRGAGLGSTFCFTLPRRGPPSMG